MAKADPPKLIVLQSFIGKLDGREVSFLVGETVDAGHKAAKKWPQFFGPPDVRLLPAIEQATAAPGEKRGT